MVSSKISFETFNIESHWLKNDERRVDANFYAQDVMASKVIIGKLKDNGIVIKKIEDFTENIFWPGRFKRRYVSKNEGNPFLTPSEIFMFLPNPNKFIIDYAEELSIKDSWVLITRSGSIGRCLISNPLLNKFVLSDDLIRVIPNTEKAGYLYAYLNTWVGKTFLIKDQYGTTVKHVEPHHIADIPIPKLPELETEINKKILEAHELRESAQYILLTAKEMLLDQLNLPPLKEENVDYLDKDLEESVNSFQISSNDLNFRLDASFHIPLAEMAVKYLKKIEENNVGKLHELESISDSFVPGRFKRPYIKDEDKGVPLLQGKHITQIKPQGIKSIWNKMKKLDNYIVKQNWILVTCSGTIGRLSLVSDYWDGWAATNHLLRIIPNEKKINPGYLTAFLLSDYGQIQFKRLVYGGVVDEIGESGELINDIMILKPNNSDIENEIGSLVEEAYHKRDKANQIEEETIKYLENRLFELAK